MKTTADYANYLNQSDFIFQGTVLKLQSGTMDLVPVTKNTAVVKVNEIISSPRMLDDQTNQVITVELSDASQTRVGQRAIFFTAGWLCGQSIAVREIARDPQGEPKSVLALLAAREARQEQQRIKDSAVIVVGKIIRIVPAERKSRYPITCHDPCWMQAELEVESVEKGAFQEEQARILFSASTDVRWYWTPKLREGQNGVWILSSPLVDDVRTPAYAILDSHAYYPPEQLDHIRMLLQA